jgi:hypothetical protein
MDDALAAEAAPRHVVTAASTPTIAKIRLTFPPLLTVKVCRANSHSAFTTLAESDRKVTRDISAGPYQE